jgi:hypothetical protein
MPGLVPGIHVLAVLQKRKTWMAGTSPAMTGRVTLSIRTIYNTGFHCTGTTR